MEHFNSIGALARLLASKREVHMRQKRDGRQ
jgi:hypothetical protein